jgi:Uma2 family endonuclease
MWLTSLVLLSSFGSSRLGAVRPKPFLIQIICSIIRKRREDKMTQLAEKYYSYEEYLALEEEATEKHEYYQGEIFVMSGGTPVHSEIAMNTGGALISALRPSSCRVYGSDLRIRIEKEDYSTYGDVAVICGELQYYADRLDVVTNPLLIGEVLSPSTRNFDQTKKFELYRSLPSFEHYLLIDSKRVYVEYRQKSGFAWIVNFYNNLEQSIRLQLPHGEVELPLNLVYEKISFPPPAPLKPRAKRSKKSASTPNGTL